MLHIFRPYVRHELNLLATIGSQLHLAFSMLIILCMRLFYDITEQCDLERAQKIMNFDSTADVCIRM